MTGRAQLVGQVLAVGVVAALLALLGWKVLKGAEASAGVGEPALDEELLERLGAQRRGQAVRLGHVRASR